MPIEDFLGGDELSKAKLQDRVMAAVSGETGIVLHGGTTIWRCFGGRRFSKDLDFYFKKSETLKKTANRLSLSEGLRVKFERERRGTVYYNITDASTSISLQSKIRKIRKAALSTYANVDGSVVDVFSLPPEELLREKIEAYSDRRLERDVYDIRVLTNSIPDKREVKGELSAFLDSIRPPADKGALQSLVYEGARPTFEQLIDYLRRWVST